MNKEYRQIRLSITFFLGGLITLAFLYFVGLLTPGNAMKDYYYLKCFGSFVLIEVLCFVIEQLIVYFKMDEKEKEQLHLRKWESRIDNFWLEDCLLRVRKVPKITRETYQKCCKLIDELCKDKYISIENKKVLYDVLCKMWTKHGSHKGIYSVPPEIQMKWKKAQAEDKFRKMKKDF